MVRGQVVDPLVGIGAYILDFLCIHPFLDVNGRMARLLTLLLLYHAGYEVWLLVRLSGSSRSRRRCSSSRRPPGGSARTAPPERARRSALMAHEAGQ